MPLHDKAADELKAWELLLLAAYDEEFGTKHFPETLVRIQKYLVQSGLIKWQPSLSGTQRD